MLQSSIYPPSYGVPSEFFFIIKIQMEAMESLDKRVVLKSIHFTIKDKTYNKRTGKMEVINVEINRGLSKKVEGEAVPRKIILEAKVSSLRQPQSHPFSFTCAKTRS